LGERRRVVDSQFHARPQEAPMSLLPDWMIERDVKIEPFAPQQHRPGIISYGVTSYGYDVRVGRAFKVFTNVYGSTVDPKKFDPKSFVDIEADECVIPPNSFALAETVEYFDVPRDMLVICLGKSTYARCGIIVNVTPLEPEWRGKVTIEISNTTPLPAKIYANEGIAQMLFFRGEGVCRTSYADKKGKYQDQKGLTLPFVAGVPDAPASSSPAKAPKASTPTKPKRR
jgi:dCTP deaminase